MSKGKSVEKRIILMIGPPGSGKGTQGELLSAALGIPHISTGALFREEMKKGSALGKELLKEKVDQGCFASDPLVYDVVQHKLGSDACSNGCILDGFPRKVEQAEHFTEYLTQTGQREPIVIFLNISKETIIKRLKKRAKEEGRTDDTKKSYIEDRWNTYVKLTSPLIDYYSEHSQVIELKESTQPTEKKQVKDIFEQIVKRFGIQDIDQKQILADFFSKKAALCIKTAKKREVIKKHREDKSKSRRTKLLRPAKER